MRGASFTFSFSRGTRTLPSSVGCASRIGTTVCLRPNRPVFTAAQPGSPLWRSRKMSSIVPMVSPSGSTIFFPRQLWTSCRSVTETSPIVGCVTAGRRLRRAVKACSSRRAHRLPGLRRLRLGVAPGDDELVVLAVDGDRRSVADVASDQRPRDARLDLALDEAPQRARAVDRVVALARDERARRLGDLEREPPVGEAGAGAGELEVDDLLDLLEGERLEEDDLVDAVEELGAEARSQLGHHALARVLADLAVLVDPVEQVHRADVRRHDDDRVAEVDRAALGIGQAAVVEQLQEGVEDVGVGLLDLVEEHDAVGLAPHGLGELAALLVADVPGRGAHQAADRVALLVLAHVEADGVVLGVEQRPGERARELRLADPGRPEEDERADRPARVLDPRAGADDGVGDEADRLVLSDDALVQDLVEAQELLALALHQPRDRDAGPARHDLADLVVGDLLAQQRVVAALLLEARLLGVQLALEVRQPPVAQLGGAVEVVGALRLLDLAADLLDLLAQRLQALDRLALGLPLGGHRVGLCAQVGELLAQCLEALAAGRVGLLPERGLLDLELHHAARDLVELRGHRVDLGADHGARLVDEVDRLVGEEAVGDVAVRQRRRGDERGVLDADAMVDLEALAQAAEDRDRVLDGRLVDDDGLEAALERSVLLDVPAVLVERGGPDAVQLAAREHGLEHVARVHGALSGARADDGVQLVDEQQDLALGGLDLGEDGLQALLELAPVLRAGDEQPDVEGEDRLVAQPLGNVAAHDALGEALDDRRLADAGVADQDGVVLRLAREDLDDATDLCVAPDDGIHPPKARLGDEVAAVLLQGLVGGFGVGARHSLAAAHLGEDLEEALACDAVLAQQAP